MRIRRYDPDFSRRKFLADAARGVLAGGVLMPLHAAIAADGDASKAYPAELLSIDVYTKGKLKPGDTIDASNVEHVKELLQPITYEQILTQGRKLKLKAATTDVMKLSPWEYMEATVRNKGLASWDSTGNVVVQSNGQPWIGGNPFPDFKTGKDLMAAQTLGWGRQDNSLYVARLTALQPDGSIGYVYTGCWSTLQTTGRVAMAPMPYIDKWKEYLRYQTLFFLSPQDQRGTSFLNIWYYDQNKFPLLYGYLPQFRRVRQFPTTQRFEPLVPGVTLYLSDAWGAGDPMNTWGNFKIVSRGPFLAGLSDNWAWDNPNWEHKFHGGPQGKSFWDVTVELVPEAICVECQPVRYPRAPIGKKRVWFDARTQALISMVTYDRNDKPFRAYDGGAGLYEHGDQKVMDGKHPYYSWTSIMASDIQTRRVTRFEQVRELEGYHSGAGQPTEMLYDKYLTRAALYSLGAI
ncbi:MAG: DUF1329 domain-containing protein [Nevskiaceae bacterium]|nr:MAG: DUF1329 domain-containing protein [Nevskiaceae bacterium]TBR71887.1 MAG: DUF1329 domain-containing protein [Nevskiaceae bacterium]